MSEEMLGDDCNVFWNSDDPIVFNSPTWERQISLGDLEFDPANEQVEIPKRIATKTYKKGRGDWTLSFTMNIDLTNDFHMAVIASITAGDPIHLAFCLGDDIDEDPYWHAKWFASGPVGANLDEGATVEVECKPHFDTGTNDADLPTYVPNST
jgi:hypothetical protein